MTRSAATTGTGADWASLPEHLGLQVTRGEVPADLPGADHPWPWLAVTPTQALLRWGEEDDDETRLLVSDGREVVIQWDEEREPGADPSWVLQGWAVNLAMLQRGAITLHAATVQIGNSVVAIAGESGAGKSTAAMGLRQRGHQLLVDDVTLLEFRETEAGTEVWTTPFARNVHLLADTATTLGLDFEALRKLAGGREKAAFRPEEPPTEPRRLDAIVVLMPYASTGDPAIPDGGVTLETVRGAARVATLLNPTHRDGLAPFVLGHDICFAQLTRLANAVPVHVLRRPSSGFSLGEVLRLLETVP